MRGLSPLERTLLRRVVSTGSCSESGHGAGEPIDCLDVVVLTSLFHRMLVTTECCRRCSSDAQIVLHYRATSLGELLLNLDPAAA